MKDKATSYNIHTGLQFKFLAGTHAALAIEPYIMAGTEGMDLDKASKFNHFSIGYGVNLSYIWYFYNNMSAQKDAGDFQNILPMISDCSSKTLLDYTGDVHGSSNTA